MKIAIELAQEAEKRREEIEHLRNIPDDLMDKAKKAGLVTQWLAKTSKGKQRDVFETMKTLQAMAFHNASLAWVVSVTNCASLISGFVSAATAKELFANPTAMIGGFAAPAGIAQISENGLKVSGQWSWGSGVSHCSHIVAGVRLMKGADFAGIGIVFFQPDEVQLEDNWKVVGLKGTHSINYSAENIFIPNNRWVHFPPRKPVNDAPLYRFSFLGALSLSTAAVSLGLAQRAVEEIKNLVLQKRPITSKKPLAQNPITQHKIGQIQGNFLAAQSLFYQTIQNAKKEVQNNPCSIETKAAIRLAACHSTSLSVQVVRDAYSLAGGSAIWQSGKLEELHRDIHVVSQHAMVSEVNYRTAGAVILGGKVPEALL